MARNEYADFLASDFCGGIGGSCRDVSYLLLFKSKNNTLSDPSIKFKGACATTSLHSYYFVDVDRSASAVYEPRANDECGTNDSFLFCCI